MLKATQIANEVGIRSTFVETNSFWCNDDVTTEEKLSLLKEAGLEGILISVNPFIVDQVPFERIQRAVRISEKVFGSNVIVYQELFYRQFNSLAIKRTFSFEDYVQKAPYGLGYAELLPIGKATYKLASLYKGYPAVEFLNEYCREELLRKWHVHIDNYGNYMTGYCGGISLGNWLEVDEVESEVLPIVDALINKGLKGIYGMGKRFGYKDRVDYISKRHLCVDIRRWIFGQTDQFKELEPRAFYRYLESDILKF